MTLWINLFGALQLQPPVQEPRLQDVRLRLDLDSMGRPAVLVQLAELDGRICQLEGMVFGIVNHSIEYKVKCII